MESRARIGAGLLLERPGYERAYGTGGSAPEAGHTDWMSGYRPAGRIGDSIYLFKFPAGTSAPL